VRASPITVCREVNDYPCYLPTWLTRLRKYPWIPCWGERPWGRRVIISPLRWHLTKIVNKIAAWRATALQATFNLGPSWRSHSRLTEIDSRGREEVSAAPACGRIHAGRHVATKTRNRISPMKPRLGGWHQLIEAETRYYGELPLNSYVDNCRVCAGAEIRVSPAKRRPRVILRHRCVIDDVSTLWEAA